MSIIAIMKKGDNDGVLDDCEIVGKLHGNNSHCYVKIIILTFSNINSW